MTSDRTRRTGTPRAAMRTFATIAALLALPAAALAQTWQPPPKPSPGLMPNPGAGKPLYEEHCARCHGVDLKGAEEGPPFLHPVYEPSHHSDAAFQLAVATGAQEHHWKFGNMEPVPGASPDQVAHITAYVRMVQRRAGIK